MLRSPSISLFLCQLVTLLTHRENLFNAKKRVFDIQELHYSFISQ